MQERVLCKTEPFKMRLREYYSKTCQNKESLKENLFTVHNVAKKFGDRGEVVIITGCGPVVRGANPLDLP